MKRARLFVGLLIWITSSLASAALITLAATLTGPAESPPTASPGTGLAIVRYDSVLHTMLVETNFVGLTGTTTASHIHCCTTLPFTGTAGVATTTPTFTGFPLGVTSGAYDNTLDLTLASSWNPAYITANGGTTASAEAAFAAGMLTDHSYFNIHSSTFGGGEIRGFLDVLGPYDFFAELSGPAESPPTASPGTGLAIVRYDPLGHTMRVQTSFGGLTGTTTASHIHCCTAVPFTGTAGVATTTPTFTGFPLGVTSGAYDNTLDLTLASSWNPAYITANGGTTASAEAAFAAGMLTDHSYFNIHSSTFGGGEIRGFLQHNVDLQVPEPQSLALAATALLLLFGLRWSDRQARPV